MNQPDEDDAAQRNVESTGPWPFTTKHVVIHSDGTPVIHRSRHHRKGLYKVEQAAEGLAHCLWMPGQLNWWIGVIFATGALLFFLGSALVLIPSLAQTWSLSANQVNAVFFAGSIPFTTAAYLQLFQAANADEFIPKILSRRHRVTIFGWRPHEIGWLSCASQFIGTILFNFNTFDAMLPGLNWFQQDLLIWVPNFVGSVLFLLSGYLAFIETCHKYWAWEPRDIGWWITLINLLGCVAFMISAVFAFLPAHVPNFDAATISVAFTMIGGACFFVGSILMLPETAGATNNPADGGHPGQTPIVDESTD